MANMTVNQRAQFDRVELSTPTTGVAVRRPGMIVAFNVIAIAIMSVLGYAAIEAIDGWAQGVVLGMIVLTTIGAMIALSPNRRA